MVARRRATPLFALVAFIGSAGCGAAPAATADPVPEPVVTDGYTLERLHSGGPLRAPNGLALHPDGSILVASLAADSITRFDPASGGASPAVPAPDGESDDVAIGDDGTIYWTNPPRGTVGSQSPDGTVRTITDRIPWVNSIAFDRAGERLFVGQTFREDGLWEIDPQGEEPDRLVASDLGQPNAFDFGPDGQIYAPLGKTGQVARIDPESGKKTIVADGLQQPVSVRFDSSDQLYVQDSIGGALLQVDISAGSTRTVVELPVASDNMVIADDDRAYVANMADSAITEVNLADGTLRVLTSSPLAFPVDMARPSADSGEIFIADSVAVRAINPESGELREVARRHASKIEFPSAIGANAEHLVLVSEMIGSVQVTDHDVKPVRRFEGFVDPADAVELDDGSVVVAEPGLGRLVRADSDAIRPLAEGIGTPVGLASDGDGRILVADASGGRVLVVDPVSGGVTTLAEGLGTPRAVTVDAGGQVVVLDTEGGRVLRLDAEPTVLVEGLSVGQLDQPHPRSGGIGVDSDGGIYVTGDRESATFRLLEG